MAAKWRYAQLDCCDPEIQVSTEGQVQDLLSEIGDRVSRDERVLVTVMTIKSRRKLPST